MFKYLICFAFVDLFAVRLVEIIEISSANYEVENRENGMVVFFKTETQYPLTFIMRDSQILAQGRIYLLNTRVLFLCIEVFPGNFEDMFRFDEARKFWIYTPNVDL